MSRFLLLIAATWLFAAPSQAQDNAGKPDANSPEDMARLMDSVKKFDAEYNDYKVHPRRLDANLDLTGEITGYLDPILKKMQRSPYPREAYGKLYGTVVVKFEISEFGVLMGPWILKSSGHQVLDDAALEAVRTARPFPTFPSDLRKLGNIIVVRRDFNFVKGTE